MNVKNIPLQNKIRKAFCDTKLAWGICFASITLLVTITPSAWAVPGTFCWEQINCATQTLINSPWTTAKTYFDAFIGPWTLTAFWGVVVGVLWLRTQNPMLVMIVGVLVATTGVGFNQLAVGIGLMLGSVALGLALWQVVRQRSSVLSF